MPAVLGRQEGISESRGQERGGRTAQLRRLGMLLLNLLLRHDALLWLIGRLNGRFGFLRRVFVAYPVTQDYADAYTYCWVQRRCRWSPWLVGLYRQNGRVGLMTIISSVEEDFFHPGDPTYNRPHLEALLRRAEGLRQLLRAEQLSFAGILPGLFQARGLRTEGPELEVTVEAVIRAEAQLRAELGWPEETPLILLGGKGYVGRRLTERLAQRETYVVDLLPGRRVNHATWPRHLQGAAAIVINLTKKAVLSDYLGLFWKGLALLNEVYPEPSAEEIAFLSGIGVPVYHIVGVKARAWPRFPRGYNGGIPCCAAWNAPDMDVVIRRLTESGRDRNGGTLAPRPGEPRVHLGVPSEAPRPHLGCRPQTVNLILLAQAGVDGWHTGSSSGNGSTTPDAEATPPMPTNKKSGTPRTEEHHGSKTRLARPALEPVARRVHRVTSRLSTPSLNQGARWSSEPVTTEQTEGLKGDESLGRMFWSRIERSPSLPAQMVKRDGEWHTLTWAEVGEIVRELALGLLTVGRKPGDAVALLSQSRAEWVQADFAILSTGSITVPIYSTYPPEQIAYIVNDSEARTLIVEDAGQLSKVLEMWGKMDRLQQIVLMDGSAGQEPSVLTWDELRLRGRAEAERLKTALADQLNAIRPEDPATIVYTSGTTGSPKGVVQTHGNHMAALTASALATPVKPGDVHLLFLPLAHCFARLESFIGVHRGLITAFAEHLDKVADNLREVKPHFIFGVPRLFEKVYGKILANVEACPPLRRKIFSWALGVGREVSGREQEKKPIPRGLRLKRWVAHTLVFAKLHHALGGRLRFAVSGGAPLSQEIAEFFHAIGLCILEGYGLTETCPALTFNRLDHFKFGSVGQALPGVELRVAPDGEVLARGPNIATRGYLKKPEATAEAFDPDGWFHTGDIGHIDEEGFLFITDRKKDLIVTAGGMNIAPQHIENLLKDDPFFSQVLVYGDRRPYPVALIPVNQAELAIFAREHGIPFTDYAELTTHPKVVERVGRTIEETNAQLASYAKIKRFAVLPVDFSPESGELTPTLKLKRKVVAEKYQDVLESLYR